MSDEVVDVGLVAVAAFVDQCRPVNDACAIGACGIPVRVHGGVTQHRAAHPDVTTVQFPDVRHFVCDRIVAVWCLALSTIVGETTCAIVFRSQIVEVASRHIGTTRHRGASSVPIGVAGIVRQHESLIGAYHCIVCHIDKRYSMSDEVVDVGLVAVAAFVDKRRAPNNTCTIDLSM